MKIIKIKGEERVGGKKRQKNIPCGYKLTQLMTKNKWTAIWVLQFKKISNSQMLVFPT